MASIEERLNNPNLFPRLKAIFKEEWGEEIPFQYIDDGTINSEDYIFDEKIMQERKMSDEEILEYFKEELLDVFNDSIDGPESEICKKCNSYPLSSEYVLERHPFIDENTEYKLMNWCVSCQDNYIFGIKN